MSPDRAAAYTGIEASRPSDGQLFRNGETAVSEFDSINPAPPIFCEEVVRSDGFASRFRQFATAGGSAVSASVLRNASTRRPPTLDVPKSDGMRGSGMEDRIFHRLYSTRFVQPLRKRSRD